MENRNRNLAESGFLGRIAATLKNTFIGEKVREQDVFGAQPRPSDIQVYMVPGMLCRLLTSTGDRVGYTFICGAKVEVPPNQHGYIVLVPCAHEFQISGDYISVDVACPACKARGVKTEVNVQRLLDAQLPRDTETGAPIKTEETLSTRDAMLPVRYLGNLRGRATQPRLVDTWNQERGGDTEYVPAVLDSLGFGGPR